MGFEVIFIFKSMLRTVLSKYESGEVLYKMLNIQ